ncbi:MAG: hypothetical protein HQK58_16800, partial [Deltaproteobacteria bacterium]|nr:hypothetical protein [Deltaproteobacteria bacterium]
MTGLRKSGPLSIMVCLGLLMALVTLVRCAGGGGDNPVPTPVPNPIPANILLGTKYSEANVDLIQASTIYAQVIPSNG